MRFSRKTVGRWVGLCGLFGAGWLLSGCQTTELPPTWHVESPTNSIALGRLRVGDLLTVSFSDLVNPISPFEGRIKEDGTITLLLNQTFTAEGKTVVELEKDIRERYVPNLFVNLTATVRVHDRFFYVDGQVRNPNRFEYRGDITVLGTIAAAGGPTDFAQLKKVKIIRVNGKIEIVNCKKAQTDSTLDAPIYPGDRVFVAKRLL